MALVRFLRLLRLLRGLLALAPGNQDLVHHLAQRSTSSPRLRRPSRRRHARQPVPTPVPVSTDHDPQAFNTAQDHASPFLRPCPSPRTTIHRPSTLRKITPARSYARARLHGPRSTGLRHCARSCQPVPTPVPVSTIHRPPTLSQIMHASPFLRSCPSPRSTGLRHCVSSRTPARSYARARPHVPQASDTEQDHARQPVPTLVPVSTFHRPPTLSEITHASPFLRPCPSPRSTGLRHQPIPTPVLVDAERD